MDFRFECVHKKYNAMDRFSKFRAFLLFLSLLTKFGVSANVVFGILNSCSCLYYYDILSYLHKYIYLCCMYNWQLFDCFQFESCIPYFQKKYYMRKTHFFLLVIVAKDWLFILVHCGKRLALFSCLLKQKTGFFLLFIVAKVLIFTVNSYLMWVWFKSIKSWRLFSFSCCRNDSLET